MMHAEPCFHSIHGHNCVRLWGNSQDVIMTTSEATALALQLQEAVFRVRGEDAIRAFAAAMGLDADATAAWAATWSEVFGRAGEKPAKPKEGGNAA